MQIFDEKGRELGIYDICKWWIERYPEDVFINSPESVTKIREEMKKILLMKRK